MSSKLKKHGKCALTPLFKRNSPMKKYIMPEYATAPAAAAVAAAASAEAHRPFAELDQLGYCVVRSRLQQRKLISDRWQDRNLK